MKKIALAAFLVLLITIGFGVFYLLSNLDEIVKTAIETYGSQSARTEVRVGSVQLDLQDGSGKIQQMTVANPQGFSGKSAFSLGEISTQINLKSISEQVTIIEQVTIMAPEVFFELNQAGKNNLAELKRNISSKTGEAASASPSQSKGKEPRLTIRRLDFIDGNIHARVLPLEKDYELALPAIRLTDLGGKDGATPAQIADQVLKVLTDRTLAEVRKKGLDLYKAQLEGELDKKLGAEQERLGDKVKGVLGY